MLDNNKLHALHDSFHYEHAKKTSAQSDGCNNRKDV